VRLAPSENPRVDVHQTVGALADSDDDSTDRQDAIAWAHEWRKGLEEDEAGDGSD
jgi:hypothetical protein